MRDSVYNSYYFPVVAVRGLNVYQLEDYQFALNEKKLFDKKQIKQGTLMNGDVPEEEARERAKGLIHQIQEKVARQRVDIVSSIRTNINTQEGELLHAPVWFVKYNFKGKDYFILVDGNIRKVMKGDRPSVAL